RQDPLLAGVKLIAEPWDVGFGGYQVGNFPEPFGEWNGRYRDCLRAYWKGDTGMVGEFAHRITGSSGLFPWDNRPPAASVNFVTAHDGFTLADLVSHAEKHNEANGEGNRDGADDNWWWNHGAEGASSDQAVIAARKCDVRSLLATLLLSRGTPMLAMGDELGRTQQGKHNPYAHHTPPPWVDWARVDDDLASFVGELVALRRRHPALREDRWLEG